MKKQKLFTLLAALICATTAWAQTTVTTEGELRAAVQINNVNILLANDINIGSLIEITGNRTVAINMDGHTLDRGLTARGNAGQVFAVRKGATLNLNNGTLTGGWGGDSGGIDNYGTANLTDVNITGFDRTAVDSDIHDGVILSSRGTDAGAAGSTANPPRRASIYTMVN